jgi:hypothetical protein
MQSVITKQVGSQIVLAAKYYVPIILFVGSGATLLSGHPSSSNLVFRAFLNAPFFLAACLLLSITEVRVADQFLEYRRFSGWTKVPYDQIEHCRVSWFPGLAYITLIPSEKNGARIYFVSGTLVTNERPRTEITKYINEHRSGKPQRETQPANHLDARLKNPRQFCLIMGLVGFLCCIVQVLLYPSWLLEPDLHSLPSGVQFAMKILWMAGTWPWGLLSCAFLAIQVVRMRYQKKAGASAFALGLVSGAMLTRVLRP